MRKGNCCRWLRAVSWGYRVRQLLIDDQQDTIQQQMAKNKLLKTLLDTISRAEVTKRIEGYEDAAKNPFAYLTMDTKRKVGDYFLK